MECPAAVNEAMILDLDNFSQEVFDNLSERMQDTIKQSQEYQSLNTAPPIANDSSQEPGPNSQSMRNETDFEDDDIPF